MPAGLPALEFCSCLIYGIIARMDLPHDRSPDEERSSVLTPGVQSGLQALAIEPFWAFVGVWAALGGALASNQVRWNGELLSTLAMVFVLVTLGWGSLWNLTTGIVRARVVVGNQPHSRHRQPTAPPFTQPGSPAAWWVSALHRIGVWWREAFWPSVGAAWTSALLAALLIVVLSSRLPTPLWWLNLALLVLIGRGVIPRLRSTQRLDGQAAVAIGLSWMAGHMALAQFTWTSLALASIFTVAALGLLRMTAGQRGGLWLLDGAQGIAVAVLAVLKQPVAAGAVALLLFGQVSLQPSLHIGQGPSRLARRTWPWLLVALMVSAWAVP